MNTPATNTRSHTVTFDGPIGSTLRAWIVRNAGKVECVTRDVDGYWIYTRPGYFSPEMDCHTIHEYTVRETMTKARNIAPCDCDQCLAQS